MADLPTEVNPENELLVGGDGEEEATGPAIHRADGPKLVVVCYKVPEVWPGIRFPTGELMSLTQLGPIYHVHSNPEASLKSAYMSLSVANENNIQYIAFPGISCGVFQYPYNEAASVAMSTVK